MASILNLNFFKNSSTTTDAIQTQIQMLTTDATHATRTAAFSLGTMNSGTLAERLRLTGAGDLAINATNRIYLDGVAATGDTYITEFAANDFRIVVGGENSIIISHVSDYVSIENRDFRMASGQRLYLDGGGDTYISEGVANRMDLFAGGTGLSLSTTAMTLSGSWDLILSPTKRAYLDSGDDTYIQEVLANDIQVVTGAVEAMRIVTAGILIPSTDPPIANYATRHGIVKGWAELNADGTTRGDYNVSATSRTSDPGIYQVTWDTDFSSNVYVWGGNAAGGDNFVTKNNQLSGSLTYNCRDSAGTLQNQITAVVSIGPQ